MLALRPNCERCDVDLPPDAGHARICSYECTFCQSCVEVLENVCPNCGGGFVSRPVRPRNAWRPTTGLVNDPPDPERRRMSYSDEEVAALSATLRSVAPDAR